MYRQYDEDRDDMKKVDNESDHEIHEEESDDMDMMWGHHMMGHQMPEHNMPGYGMPGHGVEMMIGGVPMICYPLPYGHHMKHDEDEYMHHDMYRQQYFRPRPPYHHPYHHRPRPHYNFYPFIFPFLPHYNYGYDDYDESYDYSFDHNHY